MGSSDTDECECGHVRDEHENDHERCTAVEDGEQCACIHFDGIDDGK